MGWVGRGWIAAAAAAAIAIGFVVVVRSSSIDSAGARAALHALLSVDVGRGGGFAFAVGGGGGGGGGGAFRAASSQFLVDDLASVDGGLLRYFYLGVVEAASAGVEGGPGEGGRCCSYHCMHSIIDLASPRMRE